MSMFQASLMSRARWTTMQRNASGQSTRSITPRICVLALRVRVVVRGIKNQLSMNMVDKIMVNDGLIRF